MGPVSDKAPETILVVDDEPDTVDVISLMLEDRFQVDTALNGLDALEKICKRDYHFLLTDIQMPHLNGFDPARHVREVRPFMPIGFVTASAEEHKREITAIAAAAAVPKPFTTEDLNEAVVALDRDRRDFAQIERIASQTPVRDVTTTEVISCTPDTPTLHVAELLRKNDIGVVLVVDEGRLVGICSERDLVRSLVDSPLRCLTDPVESIMTYDPVYIDPTVTIEHADILMQKHHFRHLPVVSRGQVYGIISSRDIGISRIQYLSKQVVNE